MIWIFPAGVLGFKDIALELTDDPLSTPFPTLKPLASLFFLLQCQLPDSRQIFSSFAFLF
jgi:hypothetical protein